ncbi:NAD(P)/FAD-dependent oxidoreductase [Psychrobacter immobilis]|uniref:NAD(P)/FAD-dependent oxidoreductase n=1 Tax=Psychrobacter immobilis TaxID=498 RepID=UPI00191B4572|nr:FAD-dependent oxidoreductase [Psychrobacter immobilis]
MSFIRRRRSSIEETAKKSPSVSLDSSHAAIHKKKRVAIIGSGVSGLTCAHYLAAQFDVTVFEANDYIGGHVNTIDVALQEGKKAKSSKVEKSAIDTGFIVFNERTYPNFFRLLYDLQVPFQSTDMSFSVKNTARNFEYNGHTLNTLLSQRKNILSPKFWAFITDILQFNKQVRQLRQDYEAARTQGQDISLFAKQTLGDYLNSSKYGELFKDNYLLPMVSAIWSTSLNDVQEFPLIFFAQFFDNHGLLDVVNRPQWFTIKGGSKQYVNKLVTRFVKMGGRILVNTPVQSVIRHADKVTLTLADKTDANDKSSIKNKGSIKDKGNAAVQELVFDEVIFACHADTVLKILKNANPIELEVLSHFTFTNNTAVLHTDTSVLPKRSLAWASWNYLLDNKNAKQSDNRQAPPTAKPVLTYHMNILQRLTKRHNYLVTLNHEVDAHQVIKKIDYSHPVFNNEMIAAQDEWSRISGVDLHTHFCGAYWFNGFHEDGVRSALRVCQALGCDIDIKDTVNPNHLPDTESAHTPFRYKDLPIKADKQLRKLKKCQIVTATTNQELVAYIATLEPSAKVDSKKKLGFFACRKAKNS